MNGQERIDEMFAFIVVDDDGTEGIPATYLGNTLYPLVGADMKRVESLRPAAEDYARSSGKPVRLVRFSTREELEVIT